MNPPAQKLACVARVKNEADIIESFVRHHAALFDNLLVVDNASNDDTSDILQALLAEGLPLTLLSDDALGYRQSEVSTYLARHAFSTLECDRLFLLDADEFVRVSSREELNGLLSAIPETDHALFRWMNYVPTDTDNLREPAVPARIGHRRRDDDSSTYKIALSRSFARESSAHLTQGNHDVANSAFVSRHEESLRIAHYPVRSPEQLTLKVAIGWSAYAAMGYEDREALGRHWRSLFEMLVRDPDELFTRYSDIAYAYEDMDASFSADALVDDPLPWAHSLRYTDGSPPNVTRGLALAARAFARGYAQADEAVREANARIDEVRRIIDERARQNETAV
jgi:glycosyltransferase involved in cell wall biosynthesis